MSFCEMQLETRLVFTKSHRAHNLVMLLIQFYVKKNVKRLIQKSSLSKKKK